MGTYRVVCLTSPRSTATEPSVRDVRQTMAHQVAAVLTGNRPRFLLNPQAFDRPASVTPA